MVRPDGAGFGGDLPSPKRCKRALGCRSIIDELLHRDRALTTETNSSANVQNPRKALVNWRLVGWMLMALALSVGALATGALVGLALSFRNLPEVQQLKAYVPTGATRITDINGQPIAIIRSEYNRKVVPLEQIAEHLQRAVLAIEDDRFYEHPGIRIDTLARAALANFQEGRTVQGGSTITQQLIKNLFLTPERSLERKVAEAVLSLRIEQAFSKDQILEMYLNQVYWGNNRYGIETASRAYFNKPAKSLNLAESAMLAGMLRAPEIYSPLRNRAKTVERQRVVIARMLELGWITQAEADQARSTALVFKGGDADFMITQAPYFSSYVVRELIRKYGRDAVLKGGLRVQTTVDLKIQKLAEQTVARAAKNIRYRRAEQLALVAMDPRTGYIKAMVGGVDYQKSQYNRASQASRQPGSTFKPFVYYAALATGRYTPETPITDAPACFGRYCPKNYDLRYSGGMSLRQAMAVSRNVPVVKLANTIGMNQVILAARRAGVTAPLQPNLATSIGAGGISPLELARGFSAFANGGYRVDATAILQVTDQQGNILEQNLPVRERTLKSAPVKMINSMMMSVVSGGTGTRAQLPDGRPVAGKTGTTQDFRDAWFVGYVPQLVSVVWIGNDDYRRPMARSTAGGTYVAPIWRSFMASALRGQPVLPFPGFEPGEKPAAAKGNGAQLDEAVAEEKPKPRRRRRRRPTPETAASQSREAALPLKAAEPAPANP